MWHYHHPILQLGTLRLEVKITSSEAAQPDPEPILWSLLGESSHSLPPVSGKFRVMNGLIGLSGLGARAPCVYKTRNDELPGSSPAGCPSSHLSHLIGALTNTAQTLQTTYCRRMKNPLTCVLIVFKLKGTLGTTEIPPSACLNDSGSFSRSALAPSATTQPQTFHPVQALTLPTFWAHALSTVPAPGLWGVPSHPAELVPLPQVDFERETARWRFLECALGFGVHTSQSTQMGSTPVSTGNAVLWGLFLGLSAREQPHRLRDVAFTELLGVSSLLTGVISIDSQSWEEH